MNSTNATEVIRPCMSTNNNSMETTMVTNSGMSSTQPTTTSTSTTQTSTTQSTTTKMSTTEPTTIEISTMQSTIAEMSTTQSTTTEMSTTPATTPEVSTPTSTMPQISSTPCAPIESSTTKSSTTLSTTPEVTTQSTAPTLSTTESSTTMMFTTQTSQPDTSTMQSSSPKMSTTESTTVELSTANSTTSTICTTPSTTTAGTPNSTMITTTPAPKCDPNVYNRFVQGIIALNGKLLNEYISATAGATFMFAASSIFYLIGNVGLFQKEPEIMETLTTLNLQNKEEMRCVYPEYRSKLNKEIGDMNYYYYSNVYVSIEDPISEDFIESSRIVFNNYPQNVNFTNRAQVTDEINLYSGSRTNITDVVSPDLFSPSTSVFLVSSKSVKIDLQKLFKPSEIKERDFRSGTGKNIKVPTMFKRDIFPFMDNATLKAKIIKIPHQENNVSLVIVLPDIASKINELAKKLQDPQIFNSILNMDNSRPTIVNLYMPFINITDSMNMKNILEKTTTLKFFDAESPSLNVTTNQQLLSVTEGRMKVSLDMSGLEVTGKLTKSAIAKQSGLMVPLRDETMRVDHPFIFYYLVNNAPVLCGVCAM